jgi:hypothetical protein
VNEELLRRSYERLLVIREHEAPSRDLCPLVEEIHALVRREGDEAERLRRLDHVMQCPECRKEFDVLRSVEASRPPAAPSQWRLWALAAGVVLVAGASLVWKMSQPRTDVMRGSTEQVQLVTPTSPEASLPARFTWRSVPGALSYRIEFLDGAGSVSWSSEVMDTTLLLENLPVGEVTRWKVVAEFLSGLPVESATRVLRLAPASGPAE